MHKMLDRYFSDKINKFLSIGLKIYGSSDINEILKVVEYEDIIVRDTSVRWMDFKGRLNGTYNNTKKVV